MAWSTAQTKALQAKLSKIQETVQHNTQRLLEAEQLLEEARAKTNAARGYRQALQELLDEIEAEREAVDAAAFAQHSERDE
jgi:uncharacterized alpha-E superfamily protein